jgi:hypothetical protein
MNEPILKFYLKTNGFRYNFRMATGSLRKLLTLVLNVVVSVGLSVGLSVVVLSSTAFAAALPPSPELADPLAQDEPVTSTQDEAIKQTLDIGQPPPPGPRAAFQDREDFFYRYRKAITVRGGFLAATKEVDMKNTFTLLGIQYRFPNRNLTSFELGADLLLDGPGVLHVARRWEFSRTANRPYFKGGLGVQVVSEEQLVTFLKLSNYQLRGAAGFEHSVNETQSARFELELMITTKVVQAIASFGYVFGW